MTREEDNFKKAFANDKFLARSLYFQKYRDNPYQIIRLPLDTARSNFLIPRAGDIVKVIHASSGLANINIGFNYVDMDTFNFTAYRKIETYYTQIFITHAAQIGEWIEIVCGIKEWFDVED